MFGWILCLLKVRLNQKNDNQIVNLRTEKGQGTLMQRRVRQESKQGSGKPQTIRVVQVTNARI